CFNELNRRDWATVRHLVSEWSRFAFGASVVDRHVQPGEARECRVNNWRTSARTNSASAPRFRSSILTRRARGIELTPAGRAFLDHARLVLSQVEAAAEAARRVAHPSKPCFTMGFLTGHELIWMPEALRILREELPNIDVMISSQYSPHLANALLQGSVDAAFLRRERGTPELAYRALVKEPLVVILPSDHRLAALKAISPGDLVGETFVIASDTAPVLR